MFHPDERFATALEAAVTAAEADTRAEIVVVAAPRSGRYDDLAWAVGAVTALGAYLVMFFSPITFDAMWIPLDLAMVGGLTGWLVSRSPELLRGLASAERRRAQVSAAAAAIFTEERVAETAERIGVLVYISALEGEHRVIADSGARALLTDADLGGLPRRCDTEEEVFTLVSALGERLAARLPQGDAPEVNALPNRLRVRG
ncbi:hypothetical protein L6R49_28025 [Myxococcota bacterium]|nr:hypothetical protein [Myxococcota bacterium]